MPRSPTTLAALFTAAIISLSAAPAPAAENGVIRIGMTLRMIVENGIKYGQLTLAELNAVNDSGGIDGHKIQVTLLDDECNAQKGVANTNRFIEQDKVHLIIGSICSSVTLPMVDITARVAQMVSEAGVSEGTVLLYIPHTTCGLTIQENADPGVQHDMLLVLRRLIPREDPAYRHIEPNSASHLQASAMGFSHFVFVADGQLVLGQWQAIYLAEFDGPRTRRVLVKVMRET